MTNCSNTSSDLAGYDAIVTPVVVVFQLLICIVAIIGNLLVIVSVIKFGSLRNATNYFIAALAIADLFVGFNIPYYISFYFDVFYVCDFAACVGRYYMALWATNASMLLLIAVALDRYVSVVYPLRYPSLTSSRTSWITISIIYVYVTLVMCLLFWLGTQRNKIDFEECDLYYLVDVVSAALAVGSHVLVSLVSTTVLYGRIFREAYRQNRLVVAMRQPQIRRETKTAIMMVLIFGVSIVSLLPYLIVVIMRYCETGNPKMQQVLSQAKKIVVIFYFGKSAVNPIIYGWKNADFRIAFKRLLKCK